jgi:predicted phage terminase large subunit-like protein
VTIGDGIALIDDLRRTTSLPVVPLKPVDNKEIRAEKIVGLFEARRVKFRRDAAWLQDVLNESLRFPGGRHDDAVDAVVWGLLQL